MTTILFVDNTYGTLASGLLASDTTMTLTGGQGARFPTVTNGVNILYVTLLNSSNILEQIHVTAHTAGSDTFTITRAANGTTAKVWSAGDRVEARLTSESMAAIYSAASVTTTATNSWIAAQRGAVVALASTSSAVAVDLSLANNFSLTMTENTTLGSGANVPAGQSGAIAITQGAIARTMAFNPFWKWSGTSTGALSTATGAVDILTYYTITSTSAVCNLIKGVG